MLANLSSMKALKKVGGGGSINSLITLCCCVLRFHHRLWTWQMIWIYQFCDTVWLLKRPRHHCTWTLWGPWEWSGERASLIRNTPIQHFSFTHTTSPSAAAGSSAATITPPLRASMTRSFQRCIIIAFMWVREILNKVMIKSHVPFL